MKDVFGDMHPSINFIFFVIMIGCASFIQHPIYIFISILAAFTYNVLLKGWKNACATLCFVAIPMMMIITLINPLFSHYGVTILFYLENGNPITLESIVYGFVLGSMLVNAILWFSCFHIVFQSDKIIYIFGKITPIFALLFSMTLRFVPRLTKELTFIVQGQKSMGRDMEHMSFSQGIKQIGRAHV